MAIRIIFFGPLIEVAGTSELELDGVGDTAAIEQLLHQRIPGLAGRTYRIAVDKTLVGAPTPVADGATVALLPPFSGG